MKLRKIAVIGVGLIGGSIALGLKKQLGDKITIYGSCSSLKKSQQIKKEGIIDEILKNKKIPHDLELLIIATPILTSQNIIKNLPLPNSSNCLVIDVGSTKKSICKLVEQISNSNLSFIGTHPMAGKEKSGFENADPNLFKNKPWIICLTKKTKEGHLRLVKSLIKTLGTKPIIMEAKTHDKICAWASHLFLALSSILVSVIIKQNIRRKVSQIASTGFQDTTRLASHDAKMKKDILLTNKENVINCLLKVKEEIDDFIEILRENNGSRILNYLKEAKEIRDKWLL